MKILKFYSDTCGPCKALTKNLETLDIKTFNINIEVNEELTEKYNIKSVPTLIKVKNGDVVDRFTGVMSLKDLKEWIEK